MGFVGFEMRGLLSPTLSSRVRRGSYNSVVVAVMRTVTPNQAWQA